MGFWDEYRKLVFEIYERQFVRNSRYITTNSSEEHRTLLDKGWDEVSGDEVGGWVMRRDMPGSEAKGVS